VWFETERGDRATHGSPPLSIRFGTPPTGGTAAGRGDAAIRGERNPSPPMGMGNASVDAEGCGAILESFAERSISTVRFPVGCSTRVSLGKRVGHDRRAKKKWLAPIGDDGRGTRHV